MENITHPTDMLDLILLIGAIFIGLIYFSHYLFCHVAMAIGVIILFLSIAFGEAFFGCNSNQTISLYELFISLKSCLPLNPLISLYLSAILLVTAFVGYIRVSVTFGYAFFKAAYNK